MLIGSEESICVREILEGSHTLKDTENSLDQWITISDIIDAKTAATVATAALCAMCHKGYFEPPAFFIKYFIQNVLDFIYSVFSTIFSPF